MKRKLSPKRTIRVTPAGFWPRVLVRQGLRGQSNLAKLLAGCELIAAYDDIAVL